MRRCRSTTGSAAPPASTARPQVATAAPSGMLDRKVTVRFDANVGRRPAVALRAGAERDRGQARRGRDRQLHASSTRRRARSRRQAGLQCRAAQRRRLFPEDQLLLLHRAAPQGRARSATCRWCSTSIRRSRRTPTATTINTITLSYTFYPQREPARPVAERHAEIRRRDSQARSETERRPKWPTRTPSRTTTITSSIRARGRRSARSRPSCMAVGAITWMHHMFAAAPLVFGAGVIGVLYTMLGWWRDVIKEARASRAITPAWCRSRTATA